MSPPHGPGVDSFLWHTGGESVSPGSGDLALSDRSDSQQRGAPHPLPFPGAAALPAAFLPQGQPRPGNPFAHYATRPADPAQAGVPAAAPAAGGSGRHAAHGGRWADAAPSSCGAAPACTAQQPAEGRWTRRRCYDYLRQFAALSARRRAARRLSVGPLAVSCLCAEERLRWRVREGEACARALLERRAPGARPEHAMLSGFRRLDAEFASAERRLAQLQSELAESRRP
eukprot:TRINITY_DN25011_c0_g1_i2.p2 TRINITY_DN25011_c0_g1~~TRINITY_DN25011_c0_g1_i2.p2  ORF type:complete len:262 (+),score=51.92 TRINITY_DN25011_c0_g1_i2:102-788(+)